MSDRLSKITSLISIVLFVLAVLSGGYFYYKVMSMDPIPESIVIPSEKVDWAMERVGSSMGIFLEVTYILFFASIVAIIFFSAIGAFKSKKALKNSLTSIGFVLLIVLIAFFLSSSEIPVFFGYEKFNLTAGVAKTIDMGLKSMYLFFVIAVGGVIYTGLRGFLK